MPARFILRFMKSRILVLGINGHVFFVAVYVLVCLFVNVWLLSQLCARARDSIKSIYIE